MNRDDRLDLSPLDPAADAARWRVVMDSTLSRVDAVLRERRVDALTLIAGWSRPVLLAAGVVMALLIPVERALEAREHRTEQVNRLVALSESAASALPTGAEFRRALAAPVQR